MRYIFFIFGILFFLSCNEKDKVSHSQGMLFLEGTHTILQINHKNEFLSAVDNNLFWKNYAPNLPDEAVKEVLRSLPDSLNYWLSYTDKKFYIISSQTPKDTIANWQPEKDNFFSKEIKGNKWYSKRIHNRLIVSQKDDFSDIFETSVISMPDILNTLKNTIDTKVPANLFMQKSVSSDFFKPIFNQDITENFQEWTAIDLVMDKKSVKLNGTSLIRLKDSTSFNRTQPVFYSNNWKDIAPANISQIRSYALLEPQQDSLSDNSFYELFNSFNSMTLQGKTFQAFGLLAENNEVLKQIPIIDEEIFEEQTIYKLANNDETFSSFLGHFGFDEIPSYALLHQDFLILSKENSILKQLISDFRRNAILSATSSFRALDQQMASSANETFVASLLNNQEFEKSYPQIAKNFVLASLQISSINEFYILNFISEENGDFISSNLPKERFTSILEDTLISPPKIVLNHRSKQKEIIFQNAKNDLVLIGNNGAVLFKTPLDSPINSPIYQVDLFKNGYLQYAFTTQNSIWVIDRNGNRVAPYPQSYKGTLSPLEVYDYEGNREYRFMTVEDKTKIHLLGGRGEVVTGFSKSQEENPILQTPKHFRIQSKDYLVYPTENGTLKILHRDGRIRIPVTEKFSFSENPIIISGNEFSFTTLQGKIVNINTNGNIRFEKDILGSEHHRIARKGLEVSISGTTLKIGNHLMELPEGEYQLPKIHKIGSTLLVSIFDQEGHKVYLYNQEGMLLPNFPIHTLLDIDVSLSANQKILLAITPEPNKVVLYQLN